MKINDFNEKLENMIDSLEEAAPKNLKEAEEDLRFAGIDPDEVWKQLEKTVMKSIKEKKRKDIIKKINSCLELFLNEIFTLKHMQPVPIPVTRLKETSEKTEEQEKKELSYQYPKAVQLMHKGKYEEACVILKHLIEKNDESNISKYHYTLAHVYLALNDFHMTKKELRNVTGEFNENAQKMLTLIEKIIYNE